MDCNGGRKGAFMLLVIYVAYCTSLSSSESSQLAVGAVEKLELSPSLHIVNSPGTKPGSLVLCERVFIKGYPRLANMKKFSHSLKIIISFPVSGLQWSRVEVCLHSPLGNARNASIAVGMCPSANWEKVEKGTWTRVISPFDYRILDIRLSGLSPETFELSTEEEFVAYCVAFFFVGVLLWCMATSMSKSLVFYYSSAMLIGVFLVVLVILFQGMKLLPTGRRSSLAIFLYSSFVGIGTFLLQFVPGLLKSLLVEMGVSEELHNPLGWTLVVCVVIAGAWVGFWAIRHVVLSEDGSVDITTSKFVAWCIRMLGGVLILQSSFDALLALEALMSTIALSSIFSRFCRPKYLRRLFRGAKRLFFAIGEIEFTMFERNESNTVRKPKPSEKEEYGSPHCRSEFEVFPSSYHKTPESTKLSQAELRESTRRSTKKALQGLYSSPEFSRWVADNADRMTMTPKSSKDSTHARKRWLFQ